MEKIKLEWNGALT